jgi:hypothetical protein
MLQRITLLCTSKLLGKKSESSPTTQIWRYRGERRYSFYSFMTSALDEGE